MSASLDESLHLEVSAGKLGAVVMRTAERQQTESASGQSKTRPSRRACLGPWGPPGSFMEASSLVLGRPTCNRRRPFPELNPIRKEGKTSMLRFRSRERQEEQPAVRNEVGGKDEMPQESNTARRNHLLPPISVSLSSQLV
ncbi:hypothetical protein C4D60_Mb03t05580 [Musa balbisiana]|uniref:Uncharacterized protein n=1 Tax=Musa balbisiana TaxID=52838 RepID=A0A4S8JA66_MUSBA|nr:hypothetical protein C4D60_Mb03t05580 [Musa balbisiana]